MQLNKIYKMDAVEFLKQLPDESMDLGILDFPYNISNYGRSITKVGSNFVTANFGEWDKYNVEEHINWVLEIMKEVNRVLKKDRCVFIFLDNHYAGHYTYLIERQTELQQKCPIVLFKRNPIPQLYKRNFRSSFDFCILFVKNKDKKCAVFNFQNQTDMKNVQEYNLKKLTKHPTEKNMEIIKRFIKIGSNEGDVVFDCFMGSGTTAVASKQLGRNFVGCEINEEYIEMANKRLDSTAHQITLASPTFPTEKAINKNCAKLLLGGDK
jgi:DNA modification methylase